MSATNETTTLVCLFHQDSHAQAALQDLYQAGVDRAAITCINAKNSGTSISSALETMGVPQRDLKHLEDGVTSGGTLIAVAAITDHGHTVEKIFGRHQATKIDEAVRDGAAPPPAGMIPAAEHTAIPIVEEELHVGKRTVDRGGVRVFRRVIEMPAETSIDLREEHVVIDRTPVDRPATQADLDAQGTRSIELIETAEEAVIGRTAHVVEEVLVSKVSEDRTEHIRDSVRRTEVQVEELRTKDPLTDRKRSL